MEVRATTPAARRDLEDWASDLGEDRKVRLVRSGFTAIRSSHVCPRAADLGKPSSLATPTRAAHGRNPHCRRPCNYRFFCPAPDRVVDAVGGGVSGRLRATEEAHRGGQCRRPRAASTRAGGRSPPLRPRLRRPPPRPRRPVAGCLASKCGPTTCGPGAGQGEHGHDASVSALSWRSSSRFPVRASPLGLTLTNSARCPRTRGAFDHGGFRRSRAHQTCRVLSRRRSAAGP